MKKLLSMLFGADELANSTFKRTENGWIFKTPIFRKLFGLEPAYLVDETKKAELVALYRRTWTISMTAVFVLIIVLLPAQSMLSLSPTTLLFVSVGMGFAAGLPIWAWYGYALRPLLADSTPTSEPISRADQYRALADNMSFTKLFVFLALFLLFIAAIVAAGQFDATAIAGLILFGAGAVQYTYMLIRKITVQRRSEAARG
jgi:hypothetical protein